MATVWALSDGVYSDYGVCFVFSTKEKAEEYKAIAEQYGESYNDIEEYELDPVIKIPHKHKFKYFWNGRMNTDGNIEYMSKDSMDISNPNKSEEDYSFGTELNFSGTGPGTRVCFYGTINANNDDHACKIFGEKRSKLLREGRWITSIQELEEKGLKYESISV